MSRIACFLFAVTAILLFGCSGYRAVQKSFLKNREMNRLETSQRLEQKLDQNRSYTLFDSTNVGYTLEIRPNGAFTYSVANGFSGKADYLRLSRRFSKQQRASATEQIASLIGAEGQGKLLREQQLSIKGKNTMAKRTGTIWYYALLLAVPAAIWLYMAIKKKLKQVGQTN